MAPSLEALRHAHRAAEESEYAAERAMSEVVERLEKLRHAIQHNSASRRRSPDRIATDEIRKQLEGLERQRADLVQEKVHCSEILEKARRRTLEARKAWKDAELQVVRMRSLIPEHERMVARQKQMVAETEYELEKRREGLREAERTLELLRQELITMTGGGGVGEVRASPRSTVIPRQGRGIHVVPGGTWVPHFVRNDRTLFPNFSPTS